MLMQKYHYGGLHRLLYLEKINKEKIKKVFMWIGVGAITLVVIIPILFYWFYLRTKGKTLSFTPEFKVIDIKNSEEIDIKTSKEAIKKGKEILKKIK